MQENDREDAVQVPLEGKSMKKKTTTKNVFCARAAVPLQEINGSHHFAKCMVN